MKNSFILYTDYLSQIELLTDEQRGVLFLAIMRYAAEEWLPEMDATTEMAFSFIRQQLDRDNEKYQKISKIRREAGAKGGLATQANASFAKANQANAVFAQANQADNDNENENDNDNETDNENENVNDNGHEHDISVTKKNNNNHVHDSISSQKPSVHPRDVFDAYNRICVSLPKALKMTKSRETSIRARLKSYSLDDFEQLFQMAEESDFLSGRNGKWTGANIDWLINETNMQKVLEGKYRNRAGGESTGSAYIDTIANRVKVVDSWV